MKVQFGRINFRVDTVNRFRSFSKIYGKTHSEVLEGMLDFFEKYQLSPFQDFGPTMRGMEANIKKRINSMIAILKDIEKHQTKPTTSMLQLLFEQTTPKEKQPELLLEEFTEVEQEDELFGASGDTHLQEEKDTLQRDLDRTKSILEDILWIKIKIIKPAFGKEKLQLEMTVAEYRKLKEQLKKR
ncbi:BfmA/BtgA family mobilization protein [Maribacter litoralis]|uniref:BfmA/BtgA family mobilization protein n=1 Tax=Maribacter litoralis TaxID=2059726 RepID=UPI003F5CDD47